MHSLADVDSSCPTAAVDLSHPRASSPVEASCVRVRYRRHEATLTHDATTESVILREVNRRGKSVSVLTIPTWSVVNIETAEERDSRLARPVVVDMAKGSAERTAAVKPPVACPSGSSTSDSRNAGRRDSPGDLISSGDPAHNHSLSLGYTQTMTLSDSSPPTSNASESVSCVYYLHYVKRSLKMFNRVSTVMFSSLPESKNCVKLRSVVHGILRSVYPSGARRLLLFVCPKSGSGNAVGITNRRVLPVLRFSRHEVHMLVTTHASHCEEYIADTTREIGYQDVIVCVGGDGMIHEAVNGLYRRRNAMLSDALANDKRRGSQDNSVTRQTETVRHEGPCDGRFLRTVRLEGDVNRNKDEIEAHESGGKKDISGQELHRGFVDIFHPLQIPSFPLIATIPAGSGCGMAKTLNVPTLRRSILALVHLHSCSKDLMRLQCVTETGSERVAGLVPRGLPTTGTETAATTAEGMEWKTGQGESQGKPVSERIAFMSSSFGVINTIDRGSERLRWMGGARFTAYAAYTFMRGVRAHSVRLRYLPWRGRDGEELQKLDDSVALSAARGFSPCTMSNTCAHCSRHKITDSAASGTLASQLDGSVTVSSPSFFSFLGASCGDSPLAVQPDPVDFADDTLPWVTLDGSHYIIFISNIRDASRDLMLTPFAHMSDGALDMMFIQRKDVERGRLEVLNFFTKLETGGHVALPFVSYVKASAIELEALAEFIMSDGEVTPFTKVRITPLRGGAEFVRGL